jgi:hypothetical protein
MADEREFVGISDEHKAAWDAGDFNLAAKLVAEARAHVNTKVVNKTVRQNEDGSLSIVDKPE